MKGDYIIISDIQGTFDSLNRFFKSVEHMKRDGMICLGDIVHKFRDYTDNLCIDLVRQHADFCVRGNHEDFLNMRTLSGAPSYNTDYVKGLSDSLVLDNVFLMHSSIRERNFRNRTLEQIRDEALYIRSKYPAVRYIFFGHTHAMGAYRIEDDQILECEVNEIQLDPEGLSIINPGGIGLRNNMPNTFARLNFETGILRFFTLEESEKLAKRVDMVHRFEEAWMPNLNLYNYHDFVKSIQEDFNAYGNCHDLSLNRVLDFLKTFKQKGFEQASHSIKEKILCEYSNQLAEQVSRIYQELKDVYEMEDPIEIRKIYMEIIEEEKFA